MKKILSNYFIKVSFASLALIASAFFITQYNHYVDLRQSHFNTAQRISQGLSSQFSFFYHNVQNIALNQSVGELNRRESRDYFDSLVALYPYYDVIVLTDEKGKYVASNTVGSEGESLNVEEMRGKTFFSGDFEALSEDIQKGFIGTAARDFERNESISKMYDREKFGMSFSAEVKNNAGDTMGFVTTFINHKWLEREITGLSQELFSGRHGELGVFLLNKNNRTLASNQERGVDILGDLPFEIATANFSKHTKDLNLLEGLRSFAKFIEHPFFVVSKFSHQNFLSQMGWSLVVKMDKEKALAPMINNLAWFWGAFLLFIMVAKGFKLRTAQRLEQLWKIKEKQGELSFEEALERANFKEVAKESLEVLNEIKTLESLSLPVVESDQGGPRGDWEKLWRKTRGGFDAGLEELQVLEAGRASFGHAVHKLKTTEKKQGEIHQTLMWNIEKARSLLQDLRVHALNVEIGETATGEQAREFDSVVEKALTYFGEAKRCAEAISETRRVEAVDLGEAWRVEEGRFSQTIEKAREAFGRAQIKCNEMGESLVAFGERNSHWNVSTQRALQDRKRAKAEIKELMSQVERLEKLLSEHAEKTPAELSKAA